MTKIILEVPLKEDDLLTADFTIESMGGKFVVGTSSHRVSMQFSNMVWKGLDCLTSMMIPFNDTHV